MNKLAIFRYLTLGFLSTFLIWVVFGLGLLSIGIAIFGISTFLLSLNRRWTDYIALLIFTFGFITEVTYMLDRCLKYEQCWKTIYERSINPDMTTLFLFLSVLSVSVVVCASLSVREGRLMK